MDQDPTPYLAMKQNGATAYEVYLQAFRDGFKRHECLSLIMGVFNLELDAARKIGHEIYSHELSLSDSVYSQSDNRNNIDSNLILVVSELKQKSNGKVILIDPPSDALMDVYEAEIGMKFSAEYRYFLKNASTIFYGTIDPLIITEDRSGRGELANALLQGRLMGVPFSWLPICEDNGDYYCIADDASIRFFSGNGSSTESWPNLSVWIKQVWIDGK